MASPSDLCLLVFPSRAEVGLVGTWLLGGDVPAVGELLDGEWADLCGCPRYGWGWLAFSFREVAAEKALVGPGRKKSLLAEMEDGWTASGSRKCLPGASDVRRGI